MIRGTVILVLWVVVWSGCSLLNKAETQCHEGKPCPGGQICDVGTATCVALGADLVVPVFDLANRDLGGSVFDLANRDLAFAVPSGMAWIEGGTFLMGNDAEDDPDANSNEAPKHMETVKSFFLDQTEVTVKAYAEFLQRCGAACLGDMGSDLLPGTGGTCNWTEAGRDNHPINCVTQTAASAYCQWANKKRLPTEAEWEYAARGAVRSKYPWGSARPDDQLCWSGKQPRSGTCEVGQYAATLQGSMELRGLRGVFDLAGNVWEWTSTQYCSRSNGTGNCDSRYVVRGGSFYLFELPQTVRAAYRNSSDATNRSFFGFRCAQD